jgi:hypothetical protein
MTTVSNTDSTTQAAQIIKHVVGSWAAQSKRITDLFNLYEDEHYLNETAPARNRGIYLLGHLISSTDGMLPLLGLGDRLYPELEELFSLNPDRKFDNLPGVADLKEKWSAVNGVVAEHFSKLQPEEWLDRHVNVSPEDFALQPERNKLNVLLSRTNHISYHLGQLGFLKKK